MLISFSLENWSSFKDKVSFSLVAGRERQHNERLYHVPKYKFNVLPIAAIYGGNASGKTNLIKALSFAEAFITRGTILDEGISIEPFKLCKETIDGPASFTFELLINNLIYEYSFSLTRSRVVAEKLVEITSSSEKILFERNNSEIVFHKSFQEDKKENQFLNFAFQGTRENQLFLTNSVSQKVDVFKPIHEWFLKKLIVLGPESKGGLMKVLGDKEAFPALCKTIVELDTGISNLQIVDVPFGFDAFPEIVKKDLKSMLAEKKSATAQLILNNEVYIVRKKNEEITLQKLVSYHIAADGTEVPFEIPQESDGTRRLLELLPVFIDLAGRDKDYVFVIDELDRSLHTLLTRKLLETFLSKCNEGNESQLIFTTHDLLLMDQNLLRRDEMYITERNSSGVSSLISFSEFRDIRYDKDLRKSYLQGRLGGIPNLKINKILLNEICNHE